METDELIRAALDRAAAAAPDPATVQARLAALARRRRQRRALLAAGGGLAGLVAAAGTSVAVVGSRPRQLPRACPVTVYLRHDVTADQTAEVAATLGSIRRVGDLVYETANEAYERFRVMFSEAPDLVDSVRPDTLPSSFRLTVVDTAANRDTLDRVRGMPGVADVVSARCDVG